MPTDGAQDGYFPFRSENAKDATAKDLKEFYHVYPRGKIPHDLEAETRALHSDLVAVGATLLGWLQDRSPQEVAEALSEPLPRMLAGSEQNLLRILHYPPLEEAPEPGAVRAAAHGDINLITCLLAGSEPGLEARDTAGNWHRCRATPDDGDQCQRHARYGDAGLLPCYSSPGGQPASSAKCRALLDTHVSAPAPEVVLKPGTTAHDYLMKRLCEIGLKS